MWKGPEFPPGNIPFLFFFNPFILQVSNERTNVLSRPFSPANAGGKLFFSKSLPPSGNYWAADQPNGLRQIFAGACDATFALKGKCRTFYTAAPEAFYTFIVLDLRVPHSLVTVTSTHRSVSVSSFPSASERCLSAAGKGVKSSGGEKKYFFHCCCERSIEAIDAHRF